MGLEDDPAIYTATEQRQGDSPNSCTNLSAMVPVRTTGSLSSATSLHEDKGLCDFANSIRKAY